MASLLVLGFLGLAYGLWMQNRYLSWMATHPDYLREAGPRTDRLEYWNQTLIWLNLCVLWGYLDYIRRSRGLTWAQMYRADAVRSAKRRAIPVRLLATYAVLALIGVLYAVSYLLAQLDAYVWEQSLNVLEVGIAFPMAWLAGWIFWQVAREYRGTFYGFPIESQKDGVQREPGTDFKALSKVIAAQCILLVILYFLIAPDRRLAFFCILSFSWLNTFLGWLSARIDGFVWKMVYASLLLILLGLPLGLLAWTLQKSVLLMTALTIGLAFGAVAGLPANLKKVKANKR